MKRALPIVGLLLVLAACAPPFLIGVSTVFTGAARGGGATAGPRRRATASSATGAG